MKRLIAIFAASLLGLTLLGQVFNIAPVSTNTITGPTTNLTAGTAVDVLRSERFTIMTVVRSTNNVDTNDFIVKIQGSLDSTNWFSLATNTVLLTGTNPAVQRVSVNAADLRYFRLLGLEYIGTNQLLHTNYFFIK